MKKYSPEITLIALGLIFAGLIIAFTLAERPTVTIITGQETTIQTEGKESNTQSLQTTTEKISESTQIATNENNQSLLPVNLNTATAQDLCDNVPGVGETLACRIIEYREIYGNYSSVDELLIISGIGEQKLESIRQYITV